MEVYLPTADKEARLLMPECKSRSFRCRLPAASARAGDIAKDRKESRRSFIIIVAPEGRKVVVVIGKAMVWGAGAEALFLSMVFDRGSIVKTLFV